MMLRALRAHANSTLLDIGGNIGYYTLAAAADGHAVHVFEPVPLNAAMMQASLARNRLRGVTLHTTALGRHATELRMGTHLDNQGGLKHVAGIGDASSPAKPSLTALPSTRLDALDLSLFGPVYLKMDIEGGECDAVEGMRAVWRGAPRIIGVNLEFGPSRQRCCADWVRAGGFFDSLRTQHGLCLPPRVQYASVCESKESDLIWMPCPVASHGRMLQ